MFAGFTTLTWIHTLISLIGLGTGVVVLYGMLNAKPLPQWTLWFLITTILTNVTGFFFPFFQLLPSHIIGALSLVLLALSVVALYGKRLAGGWRKVYVITAVASLYFNVFVFVVQLFRRVPALFELAPTQKEPPFGIVQGVVLILFVWLGVRAVKGFKASTEPVRSTARV